MNNKILIFKLFSRSFIAKMKNEEEFHTIVIKEIPKYLKEGDHIELNNIINYNCANLSYYFVLKKLLIKKIKIMRTIRRKRHVRRVGYKMHIGYFHVKSTKKEQLK